MFHTLLIDPIYNVFVLILGLIPGGDVGISIILLTLLVRLVLYPVFTSSIRTQMALQAVQPELAEINDHYKDNAAERGQKTAELFKRHRIRPFMLLVSTAVQIAIFLALSYVFFRLNLPAIHTELLYSFVHAPAAVKESLFGLLDLTSSHHLVLAAIVTALQYFATRLSLMRAPVSSSASREQQAMQSMQRKMMLYFFPAMIAVLSYTFPAAVGLYMATTSAVSIGQELYIRRRPL